jgi:hypothetical protein
LRTWYCTFPWGTPIFLNIYITFAPFCFSLRLYRFVGSLLFPFCIKEEYKTNDSSTNCVADQQYIVKQNVHEFSPSPFYVQSLVLNLSTLLSSIISLLCFVGVPFLEIFPLSLDVSLHFLKVTLIFVYKKACCSYNFRSLSNSLCCIKNSVINRLQVVPFA